MRLLNRARLPSPSVGRIESEAVRLLAQADVRLDFRDCPAGGFPACAAPPGAGEIDMELLAGDSPANRNTLGYARKGVYAAVYCGRAEVLAREGIASREEIIAQAVAHETLHMLLGGDRHSVDGVMRRVWDRSDLERIAQGSHGFNARERKALHAAVVREARRRALAAGETACGADPAQGKRES